MSQYKFVWERVKTEVAVTYGDDLEYPPLPYEEEFILYSQSELELVRTVDLEVPAA